MAGLFVLAPALVSSGSHGVATTAPNLQCPVAVKRWTPRRPCDFPLRLCVSLTCGPTTAAARVGVGTTSVSSSNGRASVSKTEGSRFKS